MAQLRIVALLIQFIVATGAAVPWAHDHAELCQEQLCDHLRLCHGGSTHDELPHGRHIHFTVPDAIVDGTAESRSLAEVAPVETVSVEPDHLLARSELSLALSYDAAAQQALPDRKLSCCTAGAGCELFQVYGALRI